MIDRPTKIILLLYLAGIGFGAFLILFFSYSPWYGIGALLTMGLATYSFELLTRGEWNKGVCEKYEEPWEFVDSNMLPDGDFLYSFKCRDESISLNSTLMEKAKSQYKGKNNIK